MKIVTALILCLFIDVGVAAEFDRAQIESEVMRVLDEYMATWNRRDLAAWERTFHFPHYRLASGGMSVLQKAGEQAPPPMWNRSADGWHHSEWKRRRMIHVSPEKVHVDTRFTRYRADGVELGSYDSLYVLTRENGRWGVKLRSSFAQ